MAVNTKQKIEKDAKLSDCKRYRYRLTRIWDTSFPRVLWVMLNPSTADAEKDDPTIRRCMGFARSWDKKCLSEGVSEPVAFGGIEVVNLFPLRATYPEELKANRNASGPMYVGPDFLQFLNERHLIEAATAPENQLVVCAWGEHGNLFGRGAEVLNLLSAHVDIFVCARKNHVTGKIDQQVTKKGNPKHPLYLGGDCMPWRFVKKGAI